MKKYVLLAVLCLMTGCGVISPYRVEVQQGNMISPEMAAAVKPGMSKAQVEYILGKPLISDRMHPERWDYVYANSTENDLSRKRLTLFFKQDQLVQMIK